MALNINRGLKGLVTPPSLLFITSYSEFLNNKKKKKNQTKGVKKTVQGKGIAALHVPKMRILHAYYKHGLQCTLS